MLNMMFLRTVHQFVTVFAITASVFVGFSTSYCLRLPTSNSSGYLVHATGWTGEECRWVFDYNIPNRTNLMMVFKVLKSGTIGWGPHHYNFYTPDDPDTKWWQKGPFCRIYAKTGSNLTNCKPGKNRRELCENVIQQSMDWPPTINTEFALYSAVMSYQFIDCEANTTRNRTWMLNDIVVKELNATQHDNVTGEGGRNSTNNVHTTTMTGVTSSPGSQTANRDQTSSQTSAFLWLAVVLAMLLIFACAVIAFVLVKMRKASTSQTSSTEPQTKEVVVNELYQACD